MLNETYNVPGSLFAIIQQLEIQSIECLSLAKLFHYPNAYAKSIEKYFESLLTMTTPFFKSCKILQNTLNVINWKGFNVIFWPEYHSNTAWICGSKAVVPMLFLFFVAL